MILSSDGRYLFALENGGPSVLLLVKRDMSLPDTPVVASRSLGNSLGGRESFVLSPNGQSLVLANGAVLRTSDFSQIATLHQNQAAAFNADGTQLLVVLGNSLILYDTREFTTLRTLYPDCAQFISTDQVAYVATHDQWVVRYGNTICAVSISDRLNPPGEDGGPPPPDPLEPVVLAATVRAVFPLNESENRITAAQVDRERGLLYLGGVSNTAGQVAVVSLADLSTTSTIALPSGSPLQNPAPESLMLNDVGDRLYVRRAVDSRDGRGLEVVDTTTDSLLAAIAYPPDLFGGLILSDSAFIGNDRLLLTLVGSGSSALAVFDVRTRAAARIAANDDAPAVWNEVMAVSADRTSAFVTGFFVPRGEAGVARLDITQAVPAMTMTRALAAGGIGAAFGPGDESLYLLSGWAVNPLSLTPVGYTDFGLQIPTPDGLTVYVLSGNRLSEFDARTYQLRALYEVDNCPGSGGFAELGRTSREILWTAGQNICRVTLP
jgi:hypothetical protein